MRALIGSRPRSAIERGRRLVALSPLLLLPCIVMALPTSAQGAVRFQTAQTTVSCTWDVVGHGSAAICVRGRDGRQFWLADTGEVFRQRSDAWYGGRIRRGRVDLRGGAARYDVTCWVTSTNVRCRHNASGHGFELGPRRAVRF
jgi:hypothetical protein